MNWDWTGGVSRAANNRRKWKEKKTAEFSYQRKEDMNDLQKKRGTIL